MLSHRLGELGLDDVLHAGIDGEHHVQPVARGDILLAQRDNFPLAGIGFGDAPTAGAHEFAIEHALDAFLAAMVDAADETEHVRGVMFAGVNAQLIFLAIGENRLSPKTPKRKALFSGKLGFIQPQLHIAQRALRLFPNFARHFALEDDVAIGAEDALFVKHHLRLESLTQSLFI